MTARLFDRVLNGAARALVLTALALPFAVAADSADARPTGAQAGAETLTISPQDIAPGTAGTGSRLTNLIFQNQSADVIVLKKGRYELDSALIIFGKRNVTICGATNRASDVILEVTPRNSLPFGIVIDHSLNLTFKNLTIRTTSDGAEAVRVNTIASSAESFADDITFDRCTLQGFIGISATVRARNLTINRCNITVTHGDGAGGRGAGVVWQDGEGLFIAKSRFGTANGIQAQAGVRVRGPAGSDLSDGRRARGVIVAGNTIRGDFEFGIDLNDVKGVRVRRNTVKFGSVTQTNDNGTDRGRVGIRVARAQASGLTEGVELQRNRVRGALYGVWLRNTGRVLVDRGNFGGCGSTSTDNSFGTNGAGILVTLLSPGCATVDDNNTVVRTIDIRRCDFRGLRSPVSEPAITEETDTSLIQCFRFGNVNNRTSRNRELFLQGVTTQ